MNIFPQDSLSETEENILVELITNPIMHKYLHILAYNIGTQMILNGKAPGQTTEEYMLVGANYRGQLATIDTLLGIEKAK